MRIVNIEKHFPEISTLPHHKQEEIVERARYETFKIQGSIGKWFRNSASTLLLGIVAGLAIGFVLTLLFDLEPYWVSGVIGGCGGALGSYFGEKRYIEQIRPKVNELAREREI